MTQDTSSSNTRATRERATRIGVVTSDVRNKTIKVEFDYQIRHAKYGKFMRRTSVLHAHDEKNEARRGDTVELMQCRPLSRTKSWRLLRIIERAPVEGASA